MPEIWGVEIYIFEYKPPYTTLWPLYTPPYTYLQPLYRHPIGIRIHGGLNPP